MDQFIEFALKNWLLFLALAVILALLIGSEIFRKIWGVSTLTPIEALQMMNDQDAVIVDIRDSNGYREGHIPHARHISMDTLNTRLSELAKFKRKPIIVYCRGSGRSSSACTLLKKNGFEKVYSLDGGIMAWQNANFPTKKK